MSGDAPIEDWPHLTPAQTEAIVHEHGIMLEAARGARPSFILEVSGEQVPGNWWGHPRRY